jgi:hypothetical protein
MEIGLLNIFWYLPTAMPMHQGMKGCFVLYGKSLLRIPDRDHADTRYNNQQRRLTLFQQQDGKNISSV